MIMVHLLPIFEWIRAAGGDLWIEGDRLRYRFPSGQLPAKLLEDLKRYKTDLLHYFQLEKNMRQTGWLILSPLEAYEYRLTANHSIFLLAEDGGSWTVWRATWYQGPDPIKEKTLAAGANFLYALHKANEYIQWFLDRRKTA